MFLRALVAAPPGDVRKRISRVLNGLDAITENTESLDGVRRSLAVKPIDLLVVEHGPIKGFGDTQVSELCGLPDAPEVIVVVDDEDASRRAELQAAGACAVLYRGLDDVLFRDAFAALAQRRLEEARSRLREVPDEDYRLTDYATKSPAMRSFLQTARRIATRDSTVLLLGETGVGKGLLARSLHNEGPRSNGPFISLNCAAITETLLEAELFGHERGAFTGADRARRGYFELAQGGTLFLDEIAEMPLHLQVKLLNVLEERKVRPVGAERLVEVDFRLIAATNRNLTDEIESGRFREDLFYRLNVVTLTLPSLRERKEDIQEIAESYVEHFRTKMASDVHGFSQAAIDALLVYPWRGNIRELANSVERAVILATGDNIEVHDLPIDLQEVAPEQAIEAMPSLKKESTWVDQPWAEVRRAVLEQAELQYLELVLKATRGKVGDTAKRAGMDPRSLHAKMKKYGIRKEDFRAA